MSSLLNLGFLVVAQENGSYSGYYLVTNSLGRPLEFRLSSAVQPNKVQQVLYAGTLVPYICGELIGKALVEKAAVPVSLVVTTCEAALELRRKLDVPVAYLAGADDKRPGLDAPGGRLLCHGDYEGDPAAVMELLGQLAGGLTLAEPFNRVREAMAEARKLGVGARSAA
ncbi:MAG: hypothetical protein K2W96_19270 [Gemmataceae bacterium]|nr:hypothetical protein [Gemmataceae bacterium]